MADPLQGWFGTTFPFECSQGLAVLGIRCRGLLDARPIRLQTRQVILSDIRPKNSDAPEEERFASMKDQLRPI